MLRYEKGLAYTEYDPEEEILRDPLLLRTPLVRDGQKVVVGAEPKAWESLVKGSIL
jgi:arsenate reductase-like glutaredoxin family protein